MSRRIVFLAIALLLGSNAALFAQGGFGEADSDQDGKITLAELQTYVAGKLNGFDRFDELFAELDKDKNGSISDEEFAARMQAVQEVSSRPKQEMKKEESKPAAEDENVVEEFADRYEKMFAKRKPNVGGTISDLSAYDESGNKFDFESTRGKHTVIIFGCLT